MSKSVKIVSLGHAWSSAREFEAIARSDKFGTHRLVDDAEAADMLIFPEFHQLPDDYSVAELLDHPLHRRYPEKSFCYDERDRPWLAMAGAYVSLPAGSPYAASTFAAAYLRTNEQMLNSEPSLLYSFVGSLTHPVREQLFAITDDAAHIEQVRNFRFYDSEQPNGDAIRRHYKEVMQNSQFILCPRGVGTSSIRLYEALAAGRVPIILADAWMPPVGPSWSEFSIRIAERDVRQLPDIVRSVAGNWPEMAGKAREAFVTFYAQNVGFHWLVEGLTPLLDSGAPSRVPLTGLRDAFYYRHLAERHIGMAKSQLSRELRRLPKTIMSRN